MDVNKLDLLNGILRYDRRQFIIPIYQRKYKWTTEQCTRLLEDIMEAAKTQKEHFTGTIIYQTIRNGSFSTAYLVDGQQRVTTILLLVKALNIISSKQKDINSDFQYIYNGTHGILLADQSESKLGRKLVLGENDMSIFNAIMDTDSFENLADMVLHNNWFDEPLIRNFKVIQTLLIREQNSLRNNVYEGLLLLSAVEMVLDRDDDPQAIFESINSLGLKLTNSDLIRNYLLMANARQDELYTRYWKVIQDQFVGENNMEMFIFNYLLMKKCYRINNEDIYKEYVKFARENYDNDKEGLLKDLFEVAKIYKPFIKEDRAFSTDTNMLMQELRDMGQTTAYPFLLRVFLDKEKGTIDEVTLDKVINLIIVYLVRRTVCGVGTHSLRGFLLNIYNRVFNIEENKNRYYESIYAYLNQLPTNDVLMDSEKVSTALETAEIYKNLKFTTYLLYRIENGRYPEPYNEFTLAKDVTVEHIMPQELSDSWYELLEDDADEIHKKYLNTLGNLSLSSRPKNSEMSNEAFETKKRILKEDGSKFIVLNREFLIDDWDGFGFDQIKQRATRLINKVSEFYKLEDVDMTGIRFENTVEVICTTEFDRIYNFSKPIAYKLFGKEYPANSFAQILVEVAKKLYEREPDKINELASDQYGNVWEDGDRNILHFCDTEEEGYQVVEGNLKIRTCYNAMYCVSIAATLLEKTGYDSAQLTIILKKDSIKTDILLSKNEQKRIIKKALKSLAENGGILYTDDMPESSHSIKFQTEILNETFPTEKESRWDGKLRKSIAYYGYNLDDNSIVLLFRNVKANAEIKRMLEGNKEALKLINLGGKENYLKLLEYQIDYRKAFEASNKEEEMQKQIQSVLGLMSDDVRKIQELKKTT